MSDGPGPKRTRKQGVRPCDACRRRKTRCIIEPNQSKCAICLARRNDCTFNEEAPKRSITGLVEPTRSPPGSHEVLAGEHFPGHNTSPGATSNTIGVAASTSPGHRRDTLSFRTVDEIRDKSLGLNRAKFAELYGLGSDMEPILMRHRPYDPVGHEFTLPTHSIRRVLEHDQSVDYPVTFHMVNDEKLTNYVSDSSDTDAIEACVRPHGERLLRLFWKVIHPSYPILFKEGFMKVYDKSYRSMDAHLLGAIYLNAFNWWYYDPSLSAQPAIDVTTLRKLTLQSIQNSYHRPRLSSIEAMLLLLQCKPENPLNPDHTFVWGLTAQALAIGEACGLHLDASEWAIPSWERALRKRLSWALYMQDVWTALAHGRPTHISEDDWAVTELSPEDFADCSTESSSSAGQSDTGTQLLCMAKLARILYKILKRFYSLRSTKLQDTVELFAMAQPILHELEQWYAALPPTMSMGSLPPRELSANGNLHLAYYGVKINVLRRLVRSTALAPLCLDVAVLNTIRQQAYETAQQATTLVMSLRLEHLDAFWYFSAPYLFSLIGSYCTLLLVTSLTAAERDHWREALNSYIWTLRIMSKSNEPMRYAVNRLEGAILKGLEHALVVTVDGSTPVAPEAPPGMFEADINGFGFSFPPGANGLDYSGMDLDAFDFLSNATLGQI